VPDGAKATSSVELFVTDLLNGFVFVGRIHAQRSGVSLVKCAQLGLVAL
jgi:hypothetical protein